MSGVQYNLQTLLVIRERKSQQSQGAFAQALGKLKTEEATLNVLQTKLSDIKQTTRSRRDSYFTRVGSGNVTASQLGHMESHLKALHQTSDTVAHSVKQQEQVRQLAKHHADSAKSCMNKASQELKSIEKHKSRWNTKIRLEQQRKEEEALDEIAQSQYARFALGREQ